MRTICTSLLALGLLAVAGRGEPPKGEGAKDKTADKKPKPKFTISKETTYLTGPLDKDSSVDYAAALNKRLSKGVTPANNANVLIWKVQGPHPEGATMPAEFFKWLGIQQPPEKGDYFLRLDRFLKERLNIEPGKPTNDIYEQHDRAMQAPWKEPEYPAIARWLRANDKPLALVVQATQRSRYFSPLMPRNKKRADGLITAVDYPTLQTYRELAGPLTARSMLRLSQGNVEGAWQDLLACHRLGRLLAQGGTVIEGLVGYAIDDIACGADVVFLDRARPHAKLLQQCLHDLSRLPSFPCLADKIDLSERCMRLDSILLIDQQGGLPYLERLVGDLPPEVRPLTKQILQDVDWDSTLRTVNHRYDQLAAALRLKDRAAREIQLDQLEKGMKKLLTKVTDATYLAGLLPGGKATAKARGKAIGELLASSEVLPLRKLQQSDERIRQRGDNVRVAFALALYQRDHGRYPKTLDALMPKYLAKVPQDRFSGKALIYRPTEKGYLLYSVGVNGKDEGGRSFGDMPPGDDLPVRMPQPRK